MTESDFIIYCRALLDAEWEKLRLEDLKDGADRELVGTLKLIDEALCKVDGAKKKAVSRGEERPGFNPNDAIGPGIHRNSSNDSPWEMTCTNGNPKFTSAEKERTKEELNTLNQQIKQQLND